MSEAAVSRVASDWEKLATDLRLPSEVKDDALKLLNLRYGEPARFYHTLDHIDELMRFYDEYRGKIVDNLAVRLAIMYHDIIYDPKSGTNEEDSAAIFEQWCKDMNERGILEGTNITPEIRK